MTQPEGAYLFYERIIMILVICSIRWYSTVTSFIAVFSLEVLSLPSTTHNCNIS